MSTKLSFDNDDTQTIYVEDHPEKFPRLYGLVSAGCRDEEKLNSALVEDLADFIDMDEVQIYAQINLPTLH